MNTDAECSIPIIRLCKTSLSWANSVVTGMQLTHWRLLSDRQTLCFQFSETYTCVTSFGLYPFLYTLCSLLLCRRKRSLLTLDSVRQIFKSLLMHKSLCGFLVQSTSGKWGAAGFPTACEECMQTPHVLNDWCRQLGFIVNVQLSC